VEARNDPMQTTEAVREMDTTTTMTTTWQVPASVQNGAALCWCGQDLEYVQHSHCPRCGRARGRHFDPMTLRLAG